MFFSMVCSECARARIARMNDHYDRDYAARARDLRYYLVSHTKGRKQTLLRKPCVTGWTLVPASRRL